MNHRFVVLKKTVLDQQTGLMWSLDASLAEFPVSWAEGFDFVENLNRKQYQGYGDWRVPNRKEVFSLVSHGRINPSLPEGHPFENIFHGYYWTANTCARLPGQAWYVHLGGAKVYRGMKYASYMVWPVRSNSHRSSSVFFTGQRNCYDAQGNIIPCDHNPIQEASIVSGIRWPKPRFIQRGKTVIDHLTGLVWTSSASFSRSFVTWEAAGQIIQQMNTRNAFGFNNWRLPHIRELESLTDMGTHSPALPEKHLFTDAQDFYWSGTTSAYETRYAWTLYLQDGAVGVGFKANPEFTLWPVCRPTPIINQE